MSDQPAPVGNPSPLATPDSGGFGDVLRYALPVLAAVAAGSNPALARGVGAFGSILNLQQEGALRRQALNQQQGAESDRLAAIKALGGQFDQTEGKGLPPPPGPAQMDEGPPPGASGGLSAGFRLKDAVAQDGGASKPLLTPIQQNLLSAGRVALAGGNVPEGLGFLQKLRANQIAPTDAQVAAMDLPAGMKVGGTTQGGMTFERSAKEQPTNEWTTLTDPNTDPEIKKAILAHLVAEKNPTELTALLDPKTPPNVRNLIVKKWEREGSFAPAASQLAFSPDGTPVVFDPRNKSLSTVDMPEGVKGPLTKFGASGTSTGDVKDIADAIEAGKQPPILSGLGRSGAAAAVRAELARRGYNLTQATTDYNATQKQMASLNGSQQTRLRQAISFTSESTNQIEDLFNQWQQLGGASGIRVFNKAALATSKQLPGQMGAVAQGLEAQINDLTSELATVYKGGNSSTDESLKLAAQNLQADWNPETFKKALGLIRNNLKIRQNSITSTQPVGVSPDSPYAPRGLTPPTAAPATAPNASASAPNFKYTATGKNGEKVGSNDGTTWAPIK